MSNAPGDRNRYVTVQQLTEAAPGGFPVDTWADLAGVWMHRRDLRGNEAFRSDQLGTAFDAEWTCPYRADLDPELVDVTKRRRIQYAGRVYDIVRAELAPRRDAIRFVTLSSGRVIES